MSPIASHLWRQQCGCVQEMPRININPCKAANRGISSSQSSNSRPRLVVTQPQAISHRQLTLTLSTCDDAPFYWRPFHSFCRPTSTPDICSVSKSLSSTFQPLSLVLNIRSSSLLTARLILQPCYFEDKRLVHLSDYFKKSRAPHFIALSIIPSRFQS